MIIEKCIMGYASTNTYFIKKDAKVIVVDPCLDPNGNSSALQEHIKGYDLIAILITHGHFDHISGVDALTNITPCPVYVPESEIEWLLEPNLNLSTMTPERVSIQSKLTPITPGLLEIDTFRFEVIATPGHTKGSISYIIDDHIFDGDFIMKQSIGRSDLPTGSQNDMNVAIKKFVEDYKEKDLHMYPGHGDTTTLSTEILRNPWIKAVL